MCFMEYKCFVFLFLQDQVPIQLWLSLLYQRVSVWGREFLWAAQPVEELMMISAGTCRNLDSLPNCCFTKLVAINLILRVISAAAEQNLTSLWLSVESRLTMQEITTVWEHIAAQCSHSDIQSYKNLPQLHRIQTAVLQLWPLAGDLHDCSPQLPETSWGESPVKGEVKVRFSWAWQSDLVSFL